jgi:hypothetical protein
VRTGGTSRCRDDAADLVAYYHTLLERVLDAIGQLDPSRIVEDYVLAAHFDGAVTSCPGSVPAQLNPHLPTLVRSARLASPDFCFARITTADVNLVAHK